MHANAGSSPATQTTIFLDMDKIKAFFAKLWLMLQVLWFKSGSALGLAASWLLRVFGLGFQWIAGQVFWIGMLFAGWIGKAGMALLYVNVLVVDWAETMAGRAHGLDPSKPFPFEKFIKARRRQVDE